jgi:predicted O-methyltransferase YrrM
MDFQDLCSKVYGHLTPLEAATLHDYASKVALLTKAPVVEIGSFQGRSTIALAKGSTNPVYAIDPHLPYTDVSDVNPSFQQKYGPSDMGVFIANICAFDVADKVFPVAIPSEYVIWNDDISLLFLDGDHSYWSVKGQVEEYGSHIVDGGYLILHDSQWDGIKRVIKETAYDERYKKIEEVDALTIFQIVATEEEWDGWGDDNEL